MRLLAPVFLAVAVAALGLLAMQHERRANERRLAAVASDIAGRSVQVRCPGLMQKLVDVSPNSGSVYFDSRGRPADYTELNDETCSTLSSFAEGYSGDGGSLRVARALHVLAHESFHLAGVRDEAKADCFGLQRVSFVARQLGAEPAQAERLASIARSDRLVSAPREYRSPACFDGGPLDLDPASHVWP